MAHKEQQDFLLKIKNKSTNNMKSLDEIAIYNGTDKSSLIHNYCVKYEKYLPFKRDDNLKILEIGVLNGASIKTWKDFYPNSEILGIDINVDCLKYEDTDNRILIEIGSQIDGDFLSRIIKKYGNFDLIIDDGSHMQNHIIYTFENLFDNLVEGGVYVIEDTACSYWGEYGGSLKGNNTSIEYFKKLIDHINFFGKKLQNNIFHARREDWNIMELCSPDCRIDIESINFLNGIIFINKRGK